MAKGSNVVSSTTKAVYREVDPKALLAMLEKDGGIDAAVDYWRYSQTRESLLQIAQDAREAAGAAAAKAMMRPIEARRMVDLCLLLKSVVRTARALAIPEDRVYKALNQTGTEPPTLSDEERRLATIGGIKRARRSRGTPVQGSLFALPDLRMAKAPKMVTKRAPKERLPSLFD